MSDDDKDKWLRVVRRAVDGTAWGEGPLALSKAVADSVQRQLMEDIDRLFGYDDKIVERGLLGFVRPPPESPQRKAAVPKIASVLAQFALTKTTAELLREADQLLAMYEAMHGVKL